MIPCKSRFSTYNSGVLWICEPEDSASSFNAVKNTSRRAGVTRLVKLNFEEKSRRDKDLDFAESKDRTLNMKVKCRLWEADAHHQVLIGKTLYSIIYADKDRKKQEMYLYLEEERTLT